MKSPFVEQARYILRFWFSLKPCDLIHRHRNGRVEIQRGRDHIFEMIICCQSLERKQVSPRKCVEQQRWCSQGLVYSVLVFFKHKILDNWLCLHWRNMELIYNESTTFLGTSNLFLFLLPSSTRNDCMKFRKNTIFRRKQKDYSSSGRI